MYIYSMTRFKRAESVAVVLGLAGAVRCPGIRSVRWRNRNLTWRAQEGRSLECVGPWILIFYCPSTELCAILSRAHSISHADQILHAIAWPRSISLISSPHKSP
jgi:hypothetical protein